MSSSFFSDAGWFFFTTWSLILAAVSVDAFVRDLLPSKVPVENPQRSPLPQPHLR